MSVIGVSIINYQAAAETIRCVHTLLQCAAGQENFELSIQVADNHSEETDYRQLQLGLAGAEGVSIERHELNIGFAAGHNRNINRLLAGAKPKFVWLLNNDCEIVPGAIQALLRCAEQRPKVGIWGATLLESSAGPIQCAGGCTYRPWVSSYRAHGKGDSLRRLHELPDFRFDYLAGASLFMTAQTLTSGLEQARSLFRDSAGWFLNEEFFLYFEELDLARRLRPGIEMGWCRNALIIHAGGAGTGSTDGRRSRKGEYHSTLSALKYTTLYLPGMVWLTAPIRLFAKALVNLLTLRFDLLGALYSAIVDYFAWRRGKR